MDKVFCGCRVIARGNCSVWLQMEPTESILVLELNFMLKHVSDKYINKHRSVINKIIFETGTKSISSKYHFRYHTLGSK